jgi:hypothetical protein
MKNLWKKYDFCGFYLSLFGFKKKELKFGENALFTCVFWNKKGFGMLYVKKRQNFAFKNAQNFLHKS